MALRICKPKGAQIGGKDRKGSRLEIFEGKKFVGKVLNFPSLQRRSNVIKELVVLLSRKREGTFIETTNKKIMKNDEVDLKVVYFENHIGQGHNAKRIGVEG